VPAQYLIYDPFYDVLLDVTMNQVVIVRMDH
jgi:hypothetical protein